jgi:hypothetical protein
MRGRRGNGEDKGQWLNINRRALRRGGGDLWASALGFRRIKHPCLSAVLIKQLWSDTLSAANARVRLCEMNPISIISIISVVSVILNPSLAFAGAMYISTSMSSRTIYAVYRVYLPHIPDWRSHSPTADYSELGE